jgi:hypothetical protein
MFKKAKRLYSIESIKALLQFQKYVPPDLAALIFDISVFEDSSNLALVRIV